MITLRLDPKLERVIKNIACQMGVSKSELIRKSITEFIDRLDKPSAWELGSDVFGKYSSTYESLSRDRKQLVKGKIKAKR
ncbi:MAG: CopG family transcriptional regulator [Gammaproteobacteria bacterium]